jgi:pimeloyl-ACP methyl ester carboxylesterase
MMKIAVALAAALSVTILLVWATRSRWLPHAIADAPNAGKTSEALVRHAHAATMRELRVDVGPPAATLAIAIAEPASRPVRGTVVVLHGIRDSKTSMLGLGRSFSDAGYRAVLVDLRGHGESTGDYLSFGAREGRDLVQVVERLTTEGLLALPLGVYGPSYGGAAALQLARHEPRVRAIVTVATFTRMRDIVPLYAARVAPSWFVTRRDLDDAMDRAGAHGGFRPDDSDSVAAISETKAQVLLLHGRADANIPWQHGEALHSAAPTHSRLIVVEGKDHGSIMSDETATRESLAWFDRWLGAAMDR